MVCGVGVGGELSWDKLERWWKSTKGQMPYSCRHFKRSVCAFSLLKRQSSLITHSESPQELHSSSPETGRPLASGQWAQDLRECRQVIWGHWNSELGASQGNTDKVWTETWQSKQHLLGLRVWLWLLLQAWGWGWEAGLWCYLQQVAQESRNLPSEDPRGSRKPCVHPAFPSKHHCQGRPRSPGTPHSPEKDTFPRWSTESDMGLSQQKKTQDQTGDKTFKKCTKKIKKKKST